MLRSFLGYFGILSLISLLLWADFRLFCIFSAFSTLNSQGVEYLTPSNIIIEQSQIIFECKSYKKIKNL
jgi:hypothetical protein